MPIYSPTDQCLTEVGCGLNDYCSIEIEGCTNGCFTLHGCEDNRVVIDLRCNPFTGSEATTDDVTEIEIEVSHDEGGKVVDEVWTLTGNAGMFAIQNNFTYLFSMAPADTADLATGIYDVKITFTIGGADWVAYRFNFCVERAVLASPVLNVTGVSGGTSSFSIIADTVLLHFHESDTVHSDRTWDRFVVEWGDTNTSTLDVSVLQPPSAGTWNLSHTYGAIGTYEITVTGYLSYDNGDACDVELSHCEVAEVCINTVA